MIPGPTQLLIVLLIALVIFGTKRIRDAGWDVGEAIRGFRKGFKDIDPEEIENIRDAKNEIVDGVRAVKDITRG